MNTTSFYELQFDPTYQILFVANKAASSFAVLHLRHPLLQVSFFFSPFSGFARVFGKRPLGGILVRNFFPLRLVGRFFFPISDPL